MIFTSRILLVRPARFGYNPQTAGSNAFQKSPDLPGGEISRRAMSEFEGVAEGIRRLGISVTVGEDSKEPYTPDAVFPNNWFSTHPDKTLVLYPMEAEARRRERDPALIEKIFRACGIERTLDLTSYEAEGKFLEGTGSLVLDHASRTAYACLSSRTDAGLVKEWAEEMKFEAVTFNAYGPDGTPVYHTNVLMCLGAGFAVFCAAAVSDATERERLRERLSSGGREVIEISPEQMSEFAGNMLQLQDLNGEKILVMSERARESLDPDQLQLILSRTRIASFPIPTIEHCGGGSIRCMIAELF
jgi:hypothetical protein